MSEETTAVVAAPTEALTGIEATPTPSTDGAAAVLPEAPRDVREARTSLRERIARSAAETVAATPATPSEPAPPAVVIDEAGKAHGPDGKFVSLSADAESAPAENATPEAAPAPEGMVRIELPEGHPLRERGRTHYEVRISSPEEEAELRGLLATPIKQRELKEARERVVQMEEQVLRMQAAEAARRKFEETVDPSTLEAIRAVEEVNPALAALMRRGLESSLPELEKAEFQTLAEQRVQQEVASEVEAFVNRTRTVAQAVYADIATEPYFPALYQKARAAYGAELAAREQAGQYGTQNEQEFLGYMRSFVATHPEASRVFRAKLSARQEAEREAERQRIEAETKTETERTVLTAALANRRTNPLGGVAMGMTTGRETVPDPRPGSAYDARRTLRDRMRTGA